MSDISHFFTPQKYSDLETYREELARLFRTWPGYVGHEKTIPHIWDFTTLRHEHDARALVRTPQWVNLISNICRHRQAIMRRGEGNEKVVSCPLHKWTWTNEGTMIWAPYFEESPCMHLKSWPLLNWRGLLFAWKKDISEELKNVGFENEINFENYNYHHREYHSIKNNWKTFMEVYGDDYHVAPAHPWLSKMVSMKNLSVRTWEDWHMQIVESIENTELATTPLYEKWRAECLKEWNGKLPHYGAIWFAYYPNIMIEVFPYTLTVSTLHPISPTETMNVVEFFYHSDVSEDLIQAEIAAYMETALEDDDLADRMDEGRKVLWEHAHLFREDGKLLPEDYAWPYQETMESAVKHFHVWYERNMNKSL